MNTSKTSAIRFEVQTTAGCFVEAYHAGAGDLAIAYANQLGAGHVVVDLWNGDEIIHEVAGKVRVA